MFPPLLPGGAPNGATRGARRGPRVALLLSGSRARAPARFFLVCKRRGHPHTRWLGGGAAGGLGGPRDGVFAIPAYEDVACRVGGSGGGAAARWRFVLFLEPHVPTTHDTAQSSIATVGPLHRQAPTHHPGSPPPYLALALHARARLTHTHPHTHAHTHTLEGEGEKQPSIHVSLIARHSLVHDAAATQPHPRGRL